jgi:hypothetical protein
MQAHRAERSSGDAGIGVLAVLTGSGILTFALFPLAVPGLLLFVALPLALIAVPALAVAAAVFVPIRLVRSRKRARQAASGRAARAAHGPRGCPSPQPCRS